MACGSSCSPREEGPISEDIQRRIENHPCYSKEAHFTYARMHLPVAPKCNVQCNYCNRKFDCANESRPGVSSELLTPEEALVKTKVVKKKIPNLSVIGIAGPGDPMANPENTLETFRLVGRDHPELKLCLSSNGLMVPDYLDEIAASGVDHVTLTINFIDPQIGAQIYSWVRFEGKTYRGVEAAELLHRRQMEALEGLTVRNILTKINMVLIPGINDHHLPEVAQKVSEMGAFLVNVLPFIPAKGANFEHLRAPSAEELQRVRDALPAQVRLMSHCHQCRADAIGLLGQDRSQEYTKDKLKDLYFRVAVGTKDGRAVDVHFGHAKEFSIYEYVDGEVHFLEKRPIVAYCTGKEDCDDKDRVLGQIAEMVKDCRGVLVTRIGYAPALGMAEQGVDVRMAVGAVEEAVLGYKEGRWSALTGKPAQVS